MLTLNNIEVIYDGVILVLKGVSLDRRARARITTLLGANGAGKTTTLKAISGLLASERGEVTKGTIELDGERHRPPAAARGGRARRGAGVRGAARLRKSDRRGESRRRGAQPHRPQAGARRHRARVPVLSRRAQGAPPAVGRLPVGRRAADAGDRPGADVRAQGDAARRAVAGPGAACSSRRSSASSGGSRGSESSPCSWSSRTPPWR